MSRDIGRQLLFGLLAQQMGFISRADLLSATKLLLDDRSKSLEQCLLPTNALAEADRKLLASLVDRYLTNHRGDIEKSIASLSSIGSICDDLRQLGGQDLAQTLSLVKNPTDDGADQTTHLADTDATRAWVVNSPPGTSLRFRNPRPHAKGGLGEVSVAHDIELNREVALKEIQDRFADDPASRARFLLEAEVTGGLEHPGIVPVYGLGQHEDGRPYYAMRFIRGDSLQQAADHFHYGCLKQRESPDTNAPVSEFHKPPLKQGDFAGVEFRKLLGRFIDVCQAIEYAHSRGVLHRDLKPGNIMLGKYGETLVVDWGLAKTQAGHSPAGDHHETPLRPASAGSDSNTVMGQVIGTPSFMPPEQAAGHVGQLGPASDVYSLGATLYYVLTDQSPFAGTDVHQILEDVQAGSFVPPRAIQPGVPKSLEAICLKAMSLNSNDRYATPQQLADDVERFLADEAVAALQDPMPVRVRRWMRKHPKIVASLAAALMIGLSSAIVISTIVSQKNQQLANANSLLNNSLQAEQRARTMAEVAQRDAEVNEQAARDQAQLALSTMAAVIADLQGGLKDLPGGGEVRRRLLSTSLEKLDKVASDYLEQAAVDENTMNALTEMADVVLDFGGGDVELEHEALESIDGEQQSAVRLANALYDKSHQIAESLAAARPGDRETLRRLAVISNRKGQISLTLGQIEQALEFFARSRDIDEQLVREDPAKLDLQEGLALTLTKWGDASRRAGRVPPSIEAYEQSKQIATLMAVSVMLKGSTPNQSARGGRIVRLLHMDLDRLGSAHIEIGQVNAGLNFHRQSLTVLEPWAQANPDDAVAKQQLAQCYWTLGSTMRLAGRVQESAPCFEKSLALAQELFADDPHNRPNLKLLVTAYHGLGDQRNRLGRTQEAVSLYEQAVSQAKAVVDLDPADLRSQRTLWSCYLSLADFNLAQDRLEDALVQYQAMTNIAVLQATQNPSDTQAVRDHVVSLNKLADVHKAMGNSDEALELYTQGTQIAELLAAADPLNTPLTQRLLMLAYTQQGDQLREMGRWTEAFRTYRQAVDLVESLAESNPTDHQSQRDALVAFDRMGKAYRETNQVEQAHGYFRRMFEISSRLIQVDALDVMAQQDFYATCEQLHATSLMLGRAEEALEVADSCVQFYARLDPSDLPLNKHAAALANALIKRSEAHEMLGKPQQAINDLELATEGYSRLLQEDSGNLDASHGLALLYGLIAHSHQEQGRLEEAFRYNKKALELHERLDAGEHDIVFSCIERGLLIHTLAQTAKELGRTEESLHYGEQLISLRARIIDEDPEEPEAYNVLLRAYIDTALLYRQQEKFALSAERFSEALEFATYIRDHGLLDNVQEPLLNALARDAGITLEAATVLGDWDSLLAQPDDRLAGMLERRGIQFVKQARYAEAAQAAGKLTGLDTATAEHLYNAACVFCLCAKHVQLDDEQALDPGLASQRSEWLDLAVKALELSVAKGWSDWKHLQQDDDLSLIRNRAEFKALLERTPPDRK